jgi:hypothetical protein
MNILKRVWRKRAERERKSLILLAAASLLPHYTDLPPRIARDEAISVATKLHARVFGGWIGD